MVAGTLRKRARDCEKRKRIKEFHIGDVAQFTGKWAKGMAFPEGTIHSYSVRYKDGTGHKGRIVGLVGRDIVVRGGDQWEIPASKIPPGRAYYDHWAPKKDLKLVECGKGSPVEAEALPPREVSRGRFDIEDALQDWAKKKGLPPIPPFDEEEFVRSNIFMDDTQFTQRRRR